MNSIRCMHCGFLNFATAEMCKRCQTALTQTNESEASQPEQGFNPYWNNEANQWSVPPGAYMNEPPVKPTGGKGQIAIIIFILLAAYSLRVYLFLDAVKGCAAQSLIYELGRFTGYLLGVGFICYLIWRFLLNKTNRRLALNIFMLAAVVLTGWQIQNEFNAQATTKETVRRLISKNGGLINNGGFLKKDTSPYPSGRFDRVGRTYEDAIIDIHNEAAAYNVDLGRLKAWEVRTPESIASITDVHLKRQQLAELLSFIDRHDERIKQLTKQTSAALSDAHIEGCIEREFVDGAHAALDMSRERVGEFFIIQRDFFRQADKILAFLEEKSGHYSIKNGSQFTFTSDEDKALFDFLMINLKQVSMRESEWAREMLEKQSKDFPALQSFAQ